MMNVTIPSPWRHLKQLQYPYRLIQFITALTVVAYTGIAAANNTDPLFNPQDQVLDFVKTWHNEPALFERQVATLPHEKKHQYHNQQNKVDTLFNVLERDKSELPVDKTTRFAELQELKEDALDWQATYSNPLSFYRVLDERLFEAVFIGGAIKVVMNNAYILPAALFTAALAHYGIRSLVARYHLSYLQQDLKNINELALQEAVRTWPAFRKELYQAFVNIHTNIALLHHGVLNTPSVDEKSEEQLPHPTSLPLTKAFAVIDIQEVSNILESTFSNNDNDNVLISLVQKDQQSTLYNTYRVNRHNDKYRMALASAHTEYIAFDTYKDVLSYISNLGLLHKSDLVTLSHATSN